MAAASSSTPYFGIREEESNQIKQQQQQTPTTPTSSSAPATAPQKKKRNLPGTPNPDAEVIALSPKTLMATNRFICEVCNKGFQREQNLQLHRRGHNLPWKLRQKSTKEVKRKVYLCPEPTCVHHDPSRALGDLTGIKKHFCRKHGEKKWKCDKCSKRYAVQSDWKAHSKTCGTREYRCDCGTLFSRRDSFITHRAFCDALAQESARLPSGLNTMGTHLYGGSNTGLALSQVGAQISSLHQDQAHHQPTDLLRLGGVGGPQFDHLISPSNPSPFRPPHNPSQAFFLPNSGHNFHEDQTQASHNGLMQSKPFHGLLQLPDLQANPNTASSAAAANLFNLSFFSNSSNTSTNVNNASSGLLIPDQLCNANGGVEATTLFPGSIMADHQMGSGVSSIYSSSMQNESVLPQMSATALLQKAAQMGATTSSNSGSLLRGFGSSSSGTGGPKPERPAFLPPASFRNNGSMRSHIENETHLQDLMNSLANGGSAMFGAGPAFGGGASAGSGQEQEGGYGGFAAARLSMDRQHQGFNMDETKLHQNLSVSIGGSDGLTRDFLGVGEMVRSMGAGGMSQADQHRHGIDMSSLDSDMKSKTSGSRQFGGGSLQ